MDLLFSILNWCECYLNEHACREWIEMKEPAQESERKIRFLLEPMNEQASERTNEQTEGFTTQ